jgi:hypothetical protein
MDPNTPANVAAVLGPNASVDANINQCIKVIENWASNTYVNICTGADPVVVPWGAMQYVGPILIIGMVVALILFILWLVIFDRY